MSDHQESPGAPAVSSILQEQVFAADILASQRYSLVRPFAKKGPIVGDVPI